MTKPKALIRSNGGNPTGMPDFKPMNPWGRDMPKPTRAMPHPREGKAPETDLYQIWVETKVGPTPFGPKATKQFLEPLMVAINSGIAAGRELEMFNPHFVPVSPMGTA